MKAFLKSLPLVLLALYPILIYFGLQYFSLTSIAVVALMLFFMRLWLARSSGAGQVLQFLKPMVIPVAMGGIVLSLATLLLDSEKALLFYPCLVSVASLLAFGWTLLKPPSMIECFARLVEGDLPAEGVRYTRKVTMIWCLFFLMNGCMALYTVISNDKVLWTLYNGLISYCLMGLLFALEWIWRKWVLKI